MSAVKFESVETITLGDLIAAFRKVREAQKAFFEFRKTELKHRFLADAKRAEAEGDLMAEKATKHAFSGFEGVMARKLNADFVTFRMAQKAYFAGFKTEDLGAAKRAEINFDKSLKSVISVHAKF